MPEDYAIVNLYRKHSDEGMEMTPNHNPGKTREDKAVMSIVVAIFTILISVAILYTLATSTAALAQMVAFMLVAVAFVFFALVGMHYLNEE